MAGIYPSNIITVDHLQPLLDNIQKVRDALHEDDLMTRSGHPDPKRTEKLKGLLEKLIQFKSVYFPGH